MSMHLKAGDVTDVLQVETTAVDPNQGVIPVIRISYRVKKQGPFVIDIPKSRYTAAAAIEAIKHDAEERLAVIEAFKME